MLKRCGLIGATLKHSYSKVIHQQLLVDDYMLFSLDEVELDSFLKEKDFSFVNVTIPYKQTVIKYLDEIDDNAKKINAVNTIINKNSKLYGYNTDYDGFKYLLEKNGVTIDGKKCLILGTGGTSNTVATVLKDLNAMIVKKASRRESEETLSYSSISNQQWDFQVIINTTPVGMYPNIGDTLISLENFPNLEVSVDCIYNPFRTELLINAKKRNIKAINGLDMLIYQAVRAEELYFNKTIDFNIIKKIKANICNKKNIVLIGMPGSGKTTIARLLQQTLNKEMFDIDSLIEKDQKMKISEIFTLYGEDYFRNIENKIIKEISLHEDIIISTGGGAILNQENVRYLQANGIIIFIDRSIDNISISSHRPLTKNKNDLLKLYQYRYPLYLESADIKIENNGNFKETKSLIVDKIKNYTD